MFCFEFYLLGAIFFHITYFLIFSQELIKRTYTIALAFPVSKIGLRTHLGQLVSILRSPNRSFCGIFAGFTL